MAESQNSTNENEGAGAEATGNVSASKDESQLSDWARAELSRARQEAASYRVKLRETEQALTTVQTELKSAADRSAELEVQLSDTQLNALKLQTTIEIGVPGEHAITFADRLRGSTAEELKADAEAAKALYGLGNANTRYTDPSAGLGNGQTKKTPEAAFGEFIKSRLSN